MKSERPCAGRRILVVDDDARHCRLLQYNLDRWGYASDAVVSATMMRESLLRHSYALVLLDVRLPDGDGVSLLPEIEEESPGTKTIIVSAHGTIELAMEAVRSGAFDFLTKPLDLNHCQIAVRNALALADQERECELLKEVSTERDRFGSMIGSTPAMLVIYETISNIATSNCSVLITGETGTGKELVAREIHRLSTRGKRDLITVNCAAIPSELVESEMFGHMKGAFTGAVQDKAGAAERADGSTLFLDEIGELNTELQAKLLRFLQDKVVIRVGGIQSRKVDVRIISATNCVPEEAVSAGKLRRDLLYRINVIHIHLPSLRDRRPDIPLLARTFLADAAMESGKEFSSFDSRALRILMDAPWPGNVRQLRNVITETVLLNKGHRVTAEMLPEGIRSSARTGDRLRMESVHTAAQPRIRPLWELEKTVIQRALLACHGNVVDAAGVLEISRPTVYRKIKAYGLDVGSPRSKASAGVPPVGDTGFGGKGV